MSSRKKAKKIVQQCCNPFNINHKFCEVFDVTEDNINDAMQRVIYIEMGQKICKACRHRLRRKVKSPTESGKSSPCASSSSQQSEQPTYTEVLKYS